MCNLLAIQLERHLTVWLRCTVQDAGKQAEFDALVKKSETEKASSLDDVCKELMKLVESAQPKEAILAEAGKQRLLP